MSRSLLVFIALACLSGVVLADAYKCRSLKGEVVISSVPCDQDSVTLKSKSTDFVSPEQSRQAWENVQNQKAAVQYLKSGSGSPGTGSVGVAQPVSSDVYPCLMAVTATFNLSPQQQAQRKVSCYSGMSGLADDCEKSVASTMRLPSSDERHFKAQCHAVTGG